eukprot:scaffold772_cov236-Pinguiococcus_pyrenoidosus.AAC.4
MDCKATLNQVLLPWSSATRSEPHAALRPGMRQAGRSQDAAAAAVLLFMPHPEVDRPRHCASVRHRRTPATAPATE